MNYDDLLTSQEDPTQIPPLDSRPADDFQFATDRVVADVHWIGGYWSGAGGGFDWEITLYDDFGDGTKPGTEIYSRIYPNAEVNETFIGDVNLKHYYSYSVDLAAPLACQAGTKYWISIRGVGAMPQQCGWAYHTSPIALHEAVIKSEYFGFPDWTDLSAAIGVAADMCFQLTATPHKMHFPQYPDEDGWAVQGTGNFVVADDWQCSQSGGVTDITFWGSWWSRHDEDGMASFDIEIYSDIPANPPALPHSMPGTILWSRTFYEDDWIEKEINSPTMQKFYYPRTDGDHEGTESKYYKYEILDIENPFIQTDGTIYWLAIHGNLKGGGTYGSWGWRSTGDHWNDDACWVVLGETDWREMYEPEGGERYGELMEFMIGPDGSLITAMCGACYGHFYYENYDWWNTWFYDHPYDPERYKEIEIELEWYAWDDPYSCELAISWATDQWSLDNPGIGTPPLPPLTPLQEDNYIARQLIPIDMQNPGQVEYSFTIPDYNPEWVSIDLRGYSVGISGCKIWHTPLPATSLDLAFVINTSDLPNDYGDAPDPTYPTLLASNGASHLIVPGMHLGNLVDGEADGQPSANAQGDDGNLSPDDEDGVVFTPLIFPGGSAEIEVTASVPGFLDAWIDFNGDGDWDETDDVVFVAQALSPGVNILTFTVPASAIPGTTYSRFRFSSVGGLSYDGPAPDGEVEDYRLYIIEPIGGIKMHWPQYPDLSRTGMDIGMPMMTNPLADDFRCMESGPITNIHMWGSFFDDVLPPGGPGSMTFELSIYPDIPALINPNGPWSQPDVEPLWIREFVPGSYDVTLVTDDNPEDWYDPFYQVYINDDHLQAYQFDFYIDEGDAFVQEEGTIYWLSIRPTFVQSPPYIFGWKTAEFDSRWNDNATWEIEPPYIWNPMTYPVGHEFEGEPLDLAFAITGPVVCDCRPGDADGTMPIDILDIVHLIDWKFKGCPPGQPIGTCPPPAPYPVCSGDADCNCVMDILDIVLLIDWKFKECPPGAGPGTCPPPCTCENWVAACGYPIYKK
jgi:hypothetical protein